MRTAPAPQCSRRSAICSTASSASCLFEARDAPATLVGLYYALEAVERRGSAGNRRRLNDLLDRIDARIEEWNRPPESAPSGRAVDANRKIGRMVARLRASDDHKGASTGGDHDHV